MEARNYGNNVQTSLNDISALIDASEKFPVKKHRYSIFFNASLVHDVKRVLFDSQLDRRFMEGVTNVGGGMRISNVHANIRSWFFVVQ
jgi:hypothetical protein